MDKDPTPFTALTKIHKKAVLQCLFSPDTDQILTAGEDATVVLWNIPSRDTILHDETINDEHKLVCYRLTDHKAPVISISLHQKIFISASQGHVKLWKFIPETVSRPEPRAPRFNQHSTPSIQRPARTQYVPNTYKQPSSESPADYICHQNSIRSVDISPDARKFATGSQDESVKVFSTETKNKLIHSFNGHKNWVKCVRWSKTNQNHVASCGDDGLLCIWDTRIRSGSIPIKLATRRRLQLNCLDWHPIFDHHIATGTLESLSLIWDTRAGKEIQTYSDHNGSINSVAFNPGGSLLLTGSSDTTCKIFDVHRGLNLYTLLSHKGPITSVCFNPTGELIATGSQDKTVTVWKRNFDVLDLEIAKNEETIQFDSSQQSSECLYGSYGDGSQSSQQVLGDYNDGALGYRSNIEAGQFRRNVYN